MTTITLKEYEAAERDYALHEGRIGLGVHAVVTVLIWAVLIPINVIVAPEFPWSAFVVAGTSIGLFFHWFGFKHAAADIRKRQANIEQHTLHLYGR